jgi:hypothetical protein
LSPLPAARRKRRFSVAGEGEEPDSEGATDGAAE